MGERNVHGDRQVRPAPQAGEGSPLFERSRELGGGSR
ncbi:hypothetical protein C9F11_19280 [Streptomyces sp. YIM 121038]|nr:hypothetical protein C9F11_19280 [Streptomyces sp. YIM 121038]